MKKHCSFSSNHHVFCSAQIRKVPVNGEAIVSPTMCQRVTMFLLVAWPLRNFFDLFIYLGFYVAFNTVQVISRRVVGRAEETSTYSSLGFCTVNCRPTSSNYQLSHLRLCRESNPALRGGRRECYHSATVAPGFC